jgi:hypothetical protein
MALGDVLLRLEGPLPVHERQARADGLAHDGDVIRGMQLEGEIVEPFRSHEPSVLGCFSPQVKDDGSGILSLRPPEKPCSRTAPAIIGMAGVTP